MTPFVLVATRSSRLLWRLSRGLPPARRLHCRESDGSRGRLSGGPGPVACSACSSSSGRQAARPVVRRAQRPRPAALHRGHAERPEFISPTSVAM